MKEKSTHGAGVINNHLIVVTIVTPSDRNKQMFTNLQILLLAVVVYGFNLNKRSTQSYIHYSE